MSVSFSLFFSTFSMDEVDGHGLRGNFPAKARNPPMSWNGDG